jgi:hypothetical protein
MVSLLHEGLLELIRDRPPFLGYLLSRVLDVEVPQFTEARTDDATLNQLLPAEFRADAVVMFSAGAPVLGAIVEAQLKPDDDKLFAWPVYTVAARARHRCLFELVVVTPDRGTAKWAQREIKLGNGMVFRPHVIGPDRIPKVVDPSQAVQDPELSVLSAMAHGSGDVETAVQVAQAATAATMQLPDDRRVLYSALIDAALSDAARKVLQMMPESRKFFSEIHRNFFEQGAEQGKAQGMIDAKAEMLLRFIEKRGWEIDEAQRLRIVGCVDRAMLDRWLDRVLSATSLDDLLT